MTNKKEFDLNTAFDEFIAPKMFKNGLKSYIARNKIKIKNQKDFEKTIDDYSNMKIGE